MTENWFYPIAETLRSRLTEKSDRLEFVAGIRMNGTPHIGTYLTLASTFIFASQAKKLLNLPSSVHIHFLDNDPAISTKYDQSPNGTHFHCVFQTRKPPEAAEFLGEHYFPFLHKLTVLSGCSHTWETYSLAQLEAEFRLAVLKTLRHWEKFKYYVSGPPLAGAPSGVRGIGSPCPECGLFDGWVRPEIDVDGDQRAVLTTNCCDHGTYSTVLTPTNDSFINLETTYRNVIKEMRALETPEVLTLMIKGMDWQEGLRNVDSVLEILGVPKNHVPIRFLVPVVKTESGVKFSKSAIQKFPKDFQNVPQKLLNMNLFRKEEKDYPSAIVNLAEKILIQPEFATRAVLPSDISGMMETGN